jgi:hypothetical protein
LGFALLNPTYAKITPMLRLAFTRDITTYQLVKTVGKASIIRAKSLL